MSDPIITVERLGKKYRLRHQQADGRRYKALRDVLADKTIGVARRLWSAASSVLHPPRSNSHLPPARASHEDFWALRNVSLDVQPGEVLGIIGRNGAGKSTLLKILSRITEPTEGRVRIKGRVASLLEVGTGFHPELTGRENIFLNGAILGMTRAEIKNKFDEIVAFAEVEKFLDTPVKRYSSGMYVRLAFAVAAHLEPEVLIVDEVLAVGDAQFQKKCIGRMAEVSTSGRTVLFVSHAMGTIYSLTHRCLHLKAGQVVECGPTSSVVDRYIAGSLEQRVLRPTELSPYRPPHYVDASVRITRVWVNDSTSELPRLPMCEAFTVHVELTAQRAIHGASLSLSIKNSQGVRVAIIFSWDAGFYVFLEPGKQVVDVRVEELPLSPGHYLADMGINQSTETLAWDGLFDLPLFSVANEGQVTQWLDRPWGTVHWSKARWSQQAA